MVDSSIEGSCYNKMFSLKKVYAIPNEELEELRMISNLDPEEICRLKDVYVELVGSENGTLHKDAFLGIDFVENNPLKDRLAICFGYDRGVIDLDFPQFLRGTSRFNAQLSKDEKLRLAFRMQDFDNDGVLGREDVKEYLTRVTMSSTLGDSELDDIVKEIFSEVLPNPKAAAITFQDFARCMAPTDFHTKLILPF